jgi:hypothetical protein
MTLRNLILAIRDQLPLGRAFHNFVITGLAWGLFSKNSHIILSSGKPKIPYRTKEKAIKAAVSMGRKYGGTYSAYKCAFCDGYHVGRSRTRLEAMGR